jgi:accessory colonization factor AcfC
MVEKGNPKKITSVKDLANPAIKVAVYRCGRSAHKYGTDGHTASGSAPGLDV